MNAILRALGLLTLAAAGVLHLMNFYMQSGNTFAICSHLVICGAALFLASLAWRPDNK